MKKISLKNLNSFEGQPLTREQLKNVMGGFSAATGSGCKKADGTCYFGDNCQRSSGSAGKCSTSGGSCTCS
jgi:hypothetical protein